MARRAEDVTADGAAAEGQGGAPTPARPGSFLRDSALNGLGSLVLVAARFLTMAVIARTLGVEAFGILALAILCTDLLLLIALFGLPGVTARFLPILGAEDRKAFRTWRRQWLAWSMAAVCVAAPLTGWLVLEIGPGLLVLFTVWVLAGLAQSAILAEFQGLLRFRLAFASMVLGALALLAGSWLIAWNPSLELAFLVLMAMQLVQLVPWFWLRGSEALPDHPAPMPPRSEIVGYGVNLCIISALTAIVWNRGELFVVEARLGGTTLGHYGAAVTLTGMAWRLTGLLQGAVTPHLSRAMHSPGGLGPFLGDLTRLTMAISAATALFLALFGAEVAVLAFGSAFAPAGSILAVMAPGIAMAGTMTVTLGVQMMSDARVPRNALVAGGAVLLALAWVLAGPYQAEGAAMARSITMCGVAVAMPAWLIWQGSGPLGRRIIAEFAFAASVVGVGAVISLWGGLGIEWRAVIWLSGSYAIFVRATGAWSPTGMISASLSLLRSL